MSDLFPLEAEQSNDDVIEFHTEEVDFELSRVELLKTWIQATIQNEGKNLQHITYIFCSDDYLHELNVQYLDHDTLTDIITFQYALLPDVEGDIFISIDRIRENAVAFGVAFEEELHRVMIHGVLHLCGQGDKSPEEKKQMTNKENQALTMLLELASEKNTPPQA